MAERETNVIERILFSLTTGRRNTNMATSSITKNFIVSGKKQVEKFVDAIEASYQESLCREKVPDLKITYLRSPAEVKKFMERRKKTDG